MAAVVLTCLKLMKCRHVDGTHVLVSAPEVTCYTPGHKLVMAVCVIILILTSVVVPVIISLVNFLSVHGDSEPHTGLSRFIALVFGPIVRALSKDSSTRKIWAKPSDSSKVLPSGGDEAVIGTVLLNSDAAAKGFQGPLRSSSSVDASSVAAEEEAEEDDYGDERPPCEDDDAQSTKGLQPPPLSDRPVRASWCTHAFLVIAFILTVVEFSVCAVVRVVDALLLASARCRCDGHSDECAAMPQMHCPSA